jgi:hypothetical protein
MRARITDATLKRRYRPGEDNEIWDDVLPGFGLRIGRHPAPGYADPIRFETPAKTEQSTLH